MGQPTADKCQCASHVGRLASNHMLLRALRPAWSQAVGRTDAAGIGALGVTAVISFTFVLATLVIWKLEYGKTLAGPFLTMISRRDAGEDEY